MQTNSINQGDKIVNQAPSAPRHRSKFNLSRTLYNTSRFGQVTPHFVLDTIPADLIEVQGINAVDSLSLKAPVMDNIIMKQDHFFVPYSAIMKYNWQKFVAQPNIGDDLPDVAAPCIPNIGKYAEDICAGLLTFYSTTAINAMPPMSRKGVDIILKFMFILEAFYSSGSLLNELGCNLVRAFTMSDASGVDTGETADSVFDRIVAAIVANVDYIDISDANAQLVARFFTNPIVKDNKNLRDFLEYMRGGIPSDYNVSCSYLAAKSYKTFMQDFADIFWDDLTVESGTAPVKPLFGFSYQAADSDATKFNLARLAAYQIAVSHYYSNDSVDYIYTADLWRQNLHSIQKAQPWHATFEFTYNGVDTPLDEVAWQFWSDYSGLTWNQGYLDAFFEEFTYLFCHQNSLRYVDFWTGLRTRPLAIGNTDIPVVANTVDVIDVTRSIQLQRFLNSVNRTGRKIASYISGLFGVVPESDICDPKFLFHTQSTLFNETVTNTGASQLSDAQSQTSRVNANSDYVFQCSFDAYGIMLGLTYYDIARKYDCASDPAIHIQDRFDLFNPFLENIGDQPAFLGDLDSTWGNSAQPYGYQQRYMQYKQAFDRVAGGFFENLPGFVFKYNSIAHAGDHIDPEAIRSHNRELDEFFLSLTGYSLGSYFHFINKFGVNILATREMSADAKIL